MTVCSLVWYTAKLQFSYKLQFNTTNFLDRIEIIGKTQVLYHQLFMESFYSRPSDCSRYLNYCHSLAIDYLLLLYLNYCNSLRIVCLLLLYLNYCHCPGIVCLLLLYLNNYLNNNSEHQSRLFKLQYASVQA